MKLKRKTRVTKEGLYYLGVLGFVLCGAFMREINLMIVLAGMMVGPIVISWRWAVMMLSRFEVDRKLPSGVGAGELLVVELAARNVRRRWASWAIAVEDSIRREQPAGRYEPITAIVLIGHVPAGQVSRVTYRGKLPDRGKYRFGPLVVSTRFPFGLISRSVTLDEPGSLIVYPRFGRLGPAWSRLEQLALTGKSRTQHRQGLTEGDFYGLRDWRPGDNKRWIHWRTSARRGGLMVRQFEQPRVHDFAVLVDLWQPPGAEPDRVQHVEYALSFAATIVADLCRRGASQLVLGIAGRQVVCLRGAASIALLPELLEKLAVAEATDGNQLPELFSKLSEELRPGIGVLLITTRAINQADAATITGVGHDARKANLINSMRIVEVSSATAAEYFHMEAEASQDALVQGG